MSGLFSIRWSIALLLASVFNVGIGQGQEVNLCSFSLSHGILQANTSFNVIYDFDVDASGVPIKIRPIEQKFADPADVKACIEEWRFPEAISKHLVAVFEWHHGVGWTKLAISGPGVKLAIHLSGQRCPYGGGTQNGEKPPEVSPK